MEGISATVNSMGQNSGLLSSLTDWNSTLAGYADSISTGVVMPVALTLLALFMILELYNATQRIAMNGSNNAFTIQQIALVMLKIVVCRWAVVHTTEILNALFEIASTVTVGISGYVGSGEVNTTVDIENAIGAGLYTVTLIVFAFLLCILSAFPTIEVYLKNRSNHFEIHLELKNIEYLRDFVTVSRRLGLRIDDIESNPAYVGSGLSVYTITVTICSSELKKYKTHHEIIEALKSLDYIYHLEELR